MMKPPAFADALVSGLSTSAATANEILGDLAEEWPEHVDQDGPRRAARWYWAQALRAVPHLLQQWWRETSWRTMVGVIATMALLGYVPGAVVDGAAHELRPIGPLLREPLMVVVWAATHVAVGALVARVTQKAPLVLIGALWVASFTRLVLFLATYGGHAFPVTVIGVWVGMQLGTLILMVAGVLVVVRRRELVKLVT
jgi:hypothetical protein